MSGVAGDFACDLVTLDGASKYLVLSREVDTDAYNALMCYEAGFWAAAVRYASVCPGLGGGWAHGQARTAGVGAVCRPSAGAVCRPSCSASALLSCHFSMPVRCRRLLLR